MLVFFPRASPVVRDIYIQDQGVAGTFDKPTSYPYCVWERKAAHINWSMVTCQGSTRSKIP